MVKQKGGTAGLALPLQQTVFLPKQAMGVRYIDKVRAGVFIEKLTPADKGFWLRGVYELDLEYKGVEGRGLCKHRATLPLKAAIPPGWPPGAYTEDIEAADLHAVIKKPMIRLLSPYVLEFSAELLVNYLGEFCWQKDKLKPPTMPPADSGGPRRVWCSSLPMPDVDKPEARIESKIDRFFGGRAAEKKRAEAPRLISSKGVLDDDTAPVAAPDKAQSPAASRIPQWQPDRRVSPVVKADAAPDLPEHKLPVWQPTALTETVAAKNTDNVAENTEAENTKIVENPVQNPVEKPVDNFVEKQQTPVVAAKVVGAKDQTQEQIYAPPLNKSRFRSILTAAAIARMQARGEELTGGGDEAAKAAAANVADDSSEIISVKDENKKEAAVVNVENKAAYTATDIAVDIAVDTMDKVEKEEIEEIEEISEEVVEVAEAEPVVESGAEDVPEDTIQVSMPIEVESEGAPVQQVEPSVVEVAAEVPAAPAAMPQMVNSVGVKVRLAACAADPAPPRREVPARSDSGGFMIKYYVVKPGENAMSIALKHNISIERLKEANRLPEGELAAGTLLRIPS